MNKLDPVIYQYMSNHNNHYIMREDLLPFSFGGNKLRKNFKYFTEIIKGDFNHVVTYGSKSSNHARIVANLCQVYNMKCTLITPDTNDETFNTQINHLLNTDIIYTSLDNVKKKIDETMTKLKNIGEKAYFIQGGAHGILGTKAYVDAFCYIDKYSKKENIHFDYIFIASGTGGTQAGLIIGNYLENYSSNIFGISVARSQKRGVSIINDSIKHYLSEHDLEQVSLDVNFTDHYLCGGYGGYNNGVRSTIKNYLCNYGIPLDSTYTGKAVYGMHQVIQNNNIKEKNILFIHTGGTPLFFNYLTEN